MPAPKNIAAGMLRQRIEIQDRTRVADGQGGYTDTWATITGGEVWAQVKPVRGFEQWLHDRTQHTISHTVLIRYLPGITAAMRVLYETRVFQITGLYRPDEQQWGLVLECQEIPASTAIADA